MKQGRLYALDGARGVAALFVLLFHTLGSEFKLFSNLYIAVDFFFVLSGFVLAPALARVTNLSKALSFLKSRFLRIFPMVLAVITFTVLYDLSIIAKHLLLGEDQTKSIILNVPTILFSIMMLQIFYKPAVLVDYPIWSLSAEWLANIIVISVDNFFRKKTFLSVILGALLVFISALIDSEVLNQLGRAVWGFSIGLVAFKHQNIYFRLANSIKVIAISIIPVYLMIPYFGVFQSLISVWPFVAGIVILSQQVVSVRISKLCSLLGKYSYGFYLWHFPMLSLVGYMIRDLKSENFSFSVFLLEINLTILLSVLATRISIALFEEPIRSRWK